MCGIAGVVGRDLSSEAEVLARRLCSSLQHRGPDDSGHFYDPSGKALLAHTRLSIIDLSNDAAQPMTFDQRYYLIYNGEIYNHQELRRNLEQEGLHFKTSSDTEVLLRLLIHQGKGALSLLQGMFALALWDAREQTLLLARDAFGIKPLYVSQSREHLVFASEMTSLLETALVKPDLNRRGLQEYLLWGCSGRKENLVNHVNQLPPGTSWEWKKGKLEKQVFTAIPMVFRENNATFQDFKTAWLDSIEKHFVSDVPVGLFLSGGADSSAILAGASLQGCKPALSLTLHFGDHLKSEVQEANELSKYFGIPHATQKVEASEIATLFRQHLVAQDRPSMDGFNIYCVSEAARRHGLKVMLTGLGGDELLGGYPSFTRIPRLMAVLQKFPSGIFPGSCLAGFLGDTKWARMAEWIGGPITWPHAYRCYRGIFPQKTISSLLKYWDITPDQDPTDDTVPTGPEWNDGRIQVARLEFLQYLQQQLLGDGDSCSMAHGVELRHPFLDEVLWRTGASLPASIRFDSKKRILKKCLPELPDEIFTRSKMGFSMPYDSWFDGPLREFESLIPPELSRHTHTWYQKTALISLFSWLKQNGISP